MAAERRGTRLVLAAPDSFKGTCPAAEVAAAIARAAAAARWRCDACPMSDGGEGFAGVLAAHAPRGKGRWQTARVTGPLGSPVDAPWWWAPPEAVVESAAASGLVLAGGPSGNRPMLATSRGTGELVAAALAAGASRVLVGLGGSASTDGGLGAVEALLEAGGIGEAEILVACDVETAFLDSPARFAPQKGATAQQVGALRGRLEVLAGDYRERFGVDVASLPRAGAAGGLAGGLAALGCDLVGGFDLVSGRVGLARRIGAADLVVTGEGALDATSWLGKVVGGVVHEARTRGVPVLVVAGAVDRAVEEASGEAAGCGAESPPRVVNLTARCGAARAREAPAACVAEVVEETLRVS